MTEQNREQMLGRYRLVRLLGVGGMGEVYLANAVGTAGFEKLVALKILGGRHEKDSGRVRSLMREAFIGVHLDHQNVVQILDFGEDNGRYFIAMEYIRGFNLDDIIQHASRKGKNLPVQTVVHVVRTVADALHYVQNLVNREGTPLGLIHGDLSPSNVLLGADGRIKLADFGIAALTKELKQAGTVAGKPRYLPPEAFKGARQNQSWDVYALGTVLYEALTREPVYPGKSQSEVLDAMRRGVRAVTAARPDCPKPLATVAERAVGQNPEDRFGTAAALRLALDEACPRKVDDPDRHREYVSSVYSDKEFVKAHGSLPTTGGFGTTGDLVAHVTDETAKATPGPRRAPALRFGMSPARSTEFARTYGERLADLLGQRLGRGVRTIVFGDYKTLLDCLALGEVDFAWTPPVPFVHVADRGAGTLVIAERKGRITYDSTIFVRTDSPLQTVEDLKGASFAWVDRASSSGYIFAAAEIIRTLGPLDTVLKRQHFHGSHRAVCEAVANEWADAGATYAVRDAKGNLVWSGWIDLLPDQAAEFRPLAFTEPIPGDNLSHRPGLPSRLREQLIDVLTGLGGSKEGLGLLQEMFGAENFVRGELNVYAPVREALRTVEAPPK